MSNYRDFIPTGQGIKDFFKTLLILFIGGPLLVIAFDIYQRTTTTKRERIENSIADRVESQARRKKECDRAYELEQKSIDELQVRLKEME